MAWDIPIGTNVAGQVFGNASGLTGASTSGDARVGLGKRIIGGLLGKAYGEEGSDVYNIAKQGMGNTLLGGLLGIGGGIADAIRQRRSMREARQSLEPFTDPLYGFRESRAMLDAANQMGTANLAQLAQRMGGSQGAAQAAGAEAGSQAMTNAYLGALESGRNMAFQATQAQNAFRPTTSVLGGALGQAGGLLSSIGGSMLGQAGAERSYALGSNYFDYARQAAAPEVNIDMSTPGLPYSGIGLGNTQSFGSPFFGGSTGNTSIYQVGQGFNNPVFTPMTNNLSWQ